MKFTNTTDWYYKHLHLFAWKAALYEEVPREVKMKIKVIFRPRRGKANTQPKVYVSPSNSEIEIGMPTKAVDKEYLAKMLCYGMACMTRYAARNAHSITTPSVPTSCAWADKLPLWKTPQKPVSPSHAMEKRLANAKKMTKVWERKAKLAETILHKWNRRVKLYETRLASPPKSKAPRSHYDQKLLDAIAAHDGTGA